MIVTPLATHSPRAVREYLVAHGWDLHRADTASRGIGPFAVRLDGLEPGVLVQLVRYGGELGIDVITGEDWALLAGSQARFGALARPWTGPPSLAEVADAVGRALPADLASEWMTARGPIPLVRPVIAGVLNVTPDSFSDGGRFQGLDAALDQADRMLAAGAMIVDIGGESTRPGRPEPVDEAEEKARVLPVIEALVRRHPGIFISVDTVKSPVARAAVERGAAIINDVSAFRIDPAMAGVAAAAGAGVILMHSRGSVSSMATLDHAEYESGVVPEVRAELKRAMEDAEQAGIGRGRIVLDPGLGFAKTAEHNLLLCDQLEAIVALGAPVLVGPSRKRFLGSITGREVSERDVATAAACVVAYERGARLFRVHNVPLTRDALAVASAIRGVA